MNELLAFIEFLCLAFGIAAAWLLILIFLTANHRNK